MRNNAFWISLGLVWTLLICGAADASEVKVHGKVHYKPISNAEMKLSDNQILRWQEFVGPITDETEGVSPLAASTKNDQRCLGTLIFSDKNVLVGGHGVCDVVDGDGHLWWLNFLVVGDNNSRWVVGGGTGKYEGMKGQGTTHVTSADPKTGETDQTFEGVVTTK